jgi:hypothetical protein
MGADHEYGFTTRTAQRRAHHVVRTTSCDGPHGSAP